MQQQQQSAQADTMKSSVNGYHESLIEALRNAAATTSSQRGSNSSNSFGLGAGGGANTGGAGSNHRSSAASLTVNFNYKGRPFAQFGQTSLPGVCRGFMPPQLKPFAQIV